MDTAGWGSLDDVHGAGCGVDVVDEDDVADACVGWFVDGDVAGLERAGGCVGELCGVEGL